MGGHSLHVFSAHILVFYALDLLLMYYKPSVLMANVLVLLSPLPLYAAAWAHQKHVNSGKRAKEMANIRAA